MIRVLAVAQGTILLGIMLVIWVTWGPMNRALASSKETPFLARPNGGVGSEKHANGWINHTSDGTLLRDYFGSSETVSYARKDYSRSDLHDLVGRLAQPFTIWNHSDPHSWCHSNSERNSGILYVKLPKCASSTAAGVALRVADKLGSRVLGFNQKCHAIYRHGAAASRIRQYASRNKSKSFLWSIIREPTQRTISHYFFEQVSRQGIEPSEKGILAFLQENQGIKKSFMLRYLNLVPSQTDELKQIQQIIDGYDFIGVSDRMDESLVSLAMVMQVPIADMVLLSSKVAGGYDAGRTKQGCVQLKKKQRYEKVEVLLSSSAWENNNWDQLFYKAVNRSLDKTIDALGDQLVASNVEIFRDLSQRAHKECLDSAIFPCPRTLPNHTALSGNDCYFADAGCGYRCIDGVLREDSDGQWETATVSTKKVNTRVEHQSGAGAPNWIKEYAHFHQSSIGSDGIVKDGIPVLKYQCYSACAGLGGRLKGMIKSLYTAMCSGRVFLIDSPFPFPLQDYLEPNMITWNASHIADGETMNIFHRNNVGSDTIILPENKLHIAIAQAHGKEMLDMNQIWMSSTCQSFLKSHILDSNEVQDDTQLFHWGHHFLFRFSPQVVSRANEIKSEAGLQATAPFVGIHLRTGAGDTWKEKSQRLRKAKLASHTPFAECMQLFHIRHGFSQGYLACDNAGPKAELRAKTDMFKTANVESFHIDRSLSTNTSVGNATFIDTGSGYGNHKHGRASVETAVVGMVDLFAELLVLSESDCLIMSKSSFSYSAHFIGQQPRCGVLIDDCTEDSVQSKNNKYVMNLNNWEYV